MGWIQRLLRLEKPTESRLKELLSDIRIEEAEKRVQELEQDREGRRRFFETLRDSFNDEQ